ncbi:hypothetical protein CQ10_18810 [Bradyrhizobium valentinum]|nr:hypothetical protein CQ10_18810 [Bradyrhizobium valentinum]
MTFGIAMEGASFENAPINELLETRGQKIARDSNPFLKVIETTDAAECFPQDKEASPFPDEINRTCHWTIGVGPAFSLHAAYYPRPRANFTSKMIQAFQLFSFIIKLLIAQPSNFPHKSIARHDERRYDSSITRLILCHVFLEEFRCAQRL